MASKDLTTLTAASVLATADLFYVSQGGNSRKATGTQLKTLFSASPTLVTPVLGVAAGTSLALGGATIGSNALAVTGTVLFNSALTLGAALTYGGVALSNAVTGTGNMVLSAAPILTTPVLGVAAGTSLALGGATIGSDALAVTGTTTYVGNVTLSGSTLIFSGNISAAAWTTSGIRHRSVAATLTDTTSSGTVATAYSNAFGGNTIAASSATTYTNYFTGYFNDPVAGTNVTFTNKWALGAASFKVDGNGALSASAFAGTGTWITGGSATTTKPYALIEPTGTTSTGWSTAGTGLGVNAASGFVGNLFDLQVAGTSIVSISAAGRITTSENTSLAIRLSALTNAGFGTGVTTGLPGITHNNVEAAGFSGTLGVFAPQAGGGIVAGSSFDTIMRRAAAAVWQFGAADAASPIAQTLRAQGSRSGTDSNIGGANLTIFPGTGTGTGTLSTLILQAPVAVASGTGAQTQTTGLTIKAGVAVLTNYVVANLPAAATAGAGATAFVTDASTTLILGLGGTVAGGGANKVPIYSDGTNWVYG